MKTRVCLKYFVNDYSYFYFVCCIYFPFFYLSLIVWGTDWSHGIFNSYTSLQNILLIKYKCDINPVGLYTEANSLKIFPLASWCFFFNVDVTTDNILFCLLASRTSIFVPLLFWFNTRFVKINSLWLIF